MKKDHYFMVPKFKYSLLILNRNNVSRPESNKNLFKLFGIGH